MTIHKQLHTQTGVDCYTAIILAGKRPGIDPVAAANGVTYKAMVKIGGRTMLEYVLQALSSSKRIKNIIIVTGVGLENITKHPEVITASRGVHLSEVMSAPTISESVTCAIESCPENEVFLITTSDHPLLTSKMIDDFLSDAEVESDVRIALVKKGTIERAHPETRRTYLPFKGTKVSGANLFAIRTKNGLSAVKFYKHIEAERKKPWKMALSFGLVNLVGLLLRAFTVDQAFQRVSKKLRCNIKPVILDHADAAVDVDRPADLAYVTEIMANRLAGSCGSGRLAKVGVE